MPVLEVHTSIAAPIERVFDLCRSVDARVASSGATGERAVGGTTTGLLGPGDEVTWSARHLAVRWRLTSRITAFDRPRHFRDSMTAGVFRRFDHDHTFRVDAQRGVTLVYDRFDYTSPLGPLGRLADRLLVARHLQRFLEQRMAQVRWLAESLDAWRPFVADA